MSKDKSSRKDEKPKKEKIPDGVSEKKTFQYFDITKTPDSCTMVVVGAPGSGKTSFVENFMYFNSFRYPVARVCSGTETGYARFQSICHPLFVSNSYDEMGIKNFLYRQRSMALEGAKDSNAILILDDVTDDPQVFRTPLIRGMVKLGSRHWNNAVLFCSQAGMDFSPDVRKSISYAILFFEPSEVERKKLYLNFGGAAGSYENFCTIMDTLTGNYCCMVINNRSTSTRIEDRIMWYQTTPIKGNWKFGCKEYRDWGKDRFNPEYTETLEI